MNIWLAHEPLVVVGRLNIWLATLVIIGTSAAMIAAILLIRRHAPKGGYFDAGDRAAGVFGVLATGFALLLGFVIFLAFTKYEDARASAQAEALIVAQQYETAQLMPPHARARFSGQLICYARSVAELEWPIMASNQHPPFNPWGAALFKTLQTVEPRTASEQSAFDLWLAQTSAREEQRRARLHGGEGVVPLPVWLVLFFSATLTLLYMLFFADTGERAVVQAFMVGSITAVIVATLLLLAALNQPYQQDIGGLDPDAMRHTLELIEFDQATLGVYEVPPCDDAGRPL